MGKRNRGRRYRARRRRGRLGTYQGRYGILTPRGKRWRSVVHQLMSSWRHPNKPKPSLLRIVGVTPPRYIMARYHRYKKFIAKYRRMKNGNERRRWHGTKANCKFLRRNLPQRGRCNDKYCTICNIINTGFRLPKPDRKRFDRYGLGIYLSSTSSKSNDYAGPKNGIKTLMLCKAVIGKGKKMYKNATYFTRPPRGYDSVLGERSSVLNYDELVIYNPHALLPAYVVVYK